MAATRRANKAYAKVTTKPASAPAGAIPIKKTTSTGVGESKNFGGSDLPPGVDWAQLHMGGKPIMQFLWGRVTYAQTDEGQAELAAKSGKRPARTEMLRDRTATHEITDPDKQIDAYGDALVNDGEYLSAQDPFQVPLERYTPRGHHGVFLSKVKIQREGMIRNRMEYKPVLISDGKGGQVNVEVGGMILCSVPDATWQASKRLYDGLTKEKMVAAQEKVQAQADQVLSEHGVRDLAKRKRMTDFMGGVQTDAPEIADAEIVGAMNEQDQFAEAPGVE